MGCFVTVLLSPDGIEKTIFTSIPNSNTNYLAELFGKRIASKNGGILNREGVSIFPRSAGPIQKVGPTFWRVLKSFTPLKLVAEYAKKTKLLVIHATQDEVVGIEYVKDYDNIFGVESLWVDGNHNYTNPPEREVVIEKILSFFLLA